MVQELSREDARRPRSEGWWPFICGRSHACAGKLFFNQRKTLSSYGGRPRTLQLNDQSVPRLRSGNSLYPFIVPYRVRLVMELPSSNVNRALTSPPQQSKNE